MLDEVHSWRGEPPDRAEPPVDNHGPRSSLELDRRAEGPTSDPSIQQLHDPTSDISYYEMKTGIRKVCARQAKPSIRSTVAGSALDRALVDTDGRKRAASRPDMRHALDSQMTALRLYSRSETHIPFRDLSYWPDSANQVVAMSLLELNDVSVRLRVRRRRQPVTACR